MRHWLRRLARLDWVLIVIPLLLTGVGLVMVYSLGLAQDRMALFWGQLTFSGIAVAVFIGATWFDYRILRQSSVLLYVLGLGLLIAVLLIGQRTFGASRWITLGSFQLQPAELMKAILILVMARLLGDYLERVTWRRYFVTLVLAAVPMVLVLIQPDLGTSVILASIAAAILIASRLSVRQLVVSVGIVLLTLIGGWFSLKGYQRERIAVFLNHRSDTQGTSYNVRQSMIAVGSGGLIGQGIGRGSQSQLHFLPVAHTDFMFATIAEATGVLGSTILILLYGALIWRIWHLTTVLNDPFAMLVAIGVGAMIAIQVIINIGMNIGILPVTGIPLPFVSHGGSQLIVAAMLMGILQSMYRRRKKLEFHP